MELIKKPMWEVLVPTIHGHSNNPVKVKHHRVWDEKVREITGGLTINSPSKGQWVNSEGKIFTERVIPVRIMATEEEINQIVDFTIKHYHQEAVMFYKITNECFVKYAEGKS